MWTIIFMFCIAVAAQFITIIAKKSFSVYVENQKNHWIKLGSTAVLPPNLEPATISKRLAAKIDIVQATVSIAAVFPVLLVLLKPSSNEGFLLAILGVAAVAASYWALTWLDLKPRGRWTYDDLTKWIFSPGLALTSLAYFGLTTFFWLNPHLKVP